MDLSCFWLLLRAPIGVQLLCGGIPPARLLGGGARTLYNVCGTSRGSVECSSVYQQARAKTRREREIVVLWSRPCVVNVWWVIIIRPPPSPTDLAVAQLLAFTRHYHDHLYHHRRRRRRRRVLLERAEGPCCWRQLMESCPFEDDGINF